MKKIVCCLVSFAAALCAIADDFSLVNQGSSSAPVAWSDISNWTNRTLGAIADRIPGENDHLKANAYVALDGDYTIDTYTDYYAHLHVFRTEGIDNTVSLTVKSRLGSGGYQRYIVYNGAKIVLSDTATLNGANGDAGPSIAYINDGGTIDVFGTVNSRHMEWDIKNGGVLNFTPKSYSTGGWQADHKDKFHVAGTLNFPNGLNVIGGDKAVAQINHNSGLVMFGGGISSVCSWLYTWKAGTLSVTEDALFPANVEVAVVENANVAVDVAAGKTLAIENLNFATGANIVKKGDGTLVTETIPDSLTLQGGGVRTSSEVPSVVFAGGVIELVAETKSISCIQSVTAGEGAKAKISLRNLYLLPPGEYTIVASGNELGQSDYEFDIDASVSASVSVKDDGSVVLTITGLAEDLDSIVWNPQSEGEIWDANAFGNGRTVIFNGEESSYTGKITVKGTPKPLQVVVSGDKDYSFLGDAVDTLYVSKSGTGTLFIDGDGFSGRYFTLTGGALSFKNCEYIAAEDPLKISISGSTRLSAHKNSDLKLFDFRFNSCSADWDSMEVYSSIQSTDSIADFIVTANPSAPDGTSLAVKNVYVSGNFYVPEEDIGDWSFQGIYDDNVLFVIDGVEVFKTTGWQDTKTQSVSLSKGWHKFEIRAYDSTSGWGHANCITAKKPNEANYKAFHEQNFNMNWYDTEIDSRGFPSSIPVELTISDGSSLVFDAPGYDIKSLSLGEGCTVSIDPYTVPANKTFLIVKDAAVKAVLKGKIQESLGAAGTVVETEDGLAWEMEAVFNNVNITDLEHKDGWMIGIVPGTDEDITISGEGVAPVMDGETRTFNSITVADGASLTVASTREIPALTLNAGTAFSVVKSALGSQEFSYSECIPCENDVLIGQMDPMDSIEVLSGFSAITAGTYWGGSGKDQSYTHVIAKSINNGKSLHVQFKRYDDGYVKCAIVEFWNEKGNIKAKLVEARYWQTTDSNNVTHDFINDDGSYNQSSGTKANTDTSAGYGVKELKFSVPSRNVSIKVTAAGAFSTAGDGAVIVNVEEGCVLDLSEVEVSCGAKIVKHGDGAIVFGAENLPQTLSVEEGILVLQPGVQYDMTGIELGESVEVLVWQDDASRVAYPIAGEDGTVIYYARGTYLGDGGWNDLDNWVGGTLPLAGDIVYLPLAGSELTVNDAEAAAVSKIILADGTSAKILVDWAIPQLELAPSAGFFIGDNAEKPKITVTMDSVPSAQFALVGDTVQLPTFSIATNVTLKFSFDAKLKNLDMTVCGEVTTTQNNVGGVTFGYAEKGETSYFALYADGATIHPNAWERAACTGHYVWPDEGGRVIQLRPYHFVKCLFPCNHWADYTNPRIGVNNPIDEPCEVVFDNTTFYYNQWLFVGGAAKVRCINGASIQHGWGTGHIGTGDAPARVMDWASIELDGEKASLSAYGQSARFAFRPDADAALEVPTVTLKNGASIKGFRLEGNGEAGLYVVGAGEWTIPKLYKFGETAYSFPVLAGFAAAVVAEDSVFNIVGRNEGNCNTGSWHDWDRALPISGAILGYGDVVVSNTAPTNSMCITITNGLNECVGKISCNGDNNCSLLFAGGANWEGTVIAGNVALTNLTDGAAAASVNFAKLDLAADFPVRVWRDENGALVSDTLNVGEYLDSGAKGGRLAIAAMFEGGFAPGETFVLGTISKNAELPRVGRGWTARRVEGETVDTVEVERNSGFTITIR